MSVLIIGGGAVGTNLAYRLAAEGTTVSLLEAGAIGEGTTSATFSMTVAARKTPWEHFSLAVAGAAEHRRLTEELCIAGSCADWVHPVAAYEWATTEHDRSVIKQRLDRLRHWGYAVEVISAADLRELEPHIELDDAVEAVARYGEEAWYDATLMARTLGEAAERAGAVVRPREQVVDLVHRNAVVEATTQEGLVYTADRVVICAGPQSNQIAALFGHGLPVTGIAGLVVTSGSVPEGTLNGIVLQPHVNLRPTGTTQLLAHSYTTEAQLPDCPNNADKARWTRQVVKEATRVLPRFGQVGTASARIGVRPVPADGLPISGWLNPERTVYALVSHSGINLAPVLARLAASEILQGGTEEPLEPFRPSRRSLHDPTFGATDESTREMTRIFGAQLEERQVYEG
jgi:glycine/D-amino acid oxidase-like deaminating enzyme